MFPGFRRLQTAEFFGPFPEIDEDFSGIVDFPDIGQGTTIILGGLIPQLEVATQNECFFEEAATTSTSSGSNSSFPFTYGKEYLSVDQTWIKGDTRIFDIKVESKDNDGLADVDLTGGLLIMTAKWNYGAADGSAVFQVKSSGANSQGVITITNATAGEATVTINPAATLTLPDFKVQLDYDIQLVDSASRVYTVVYGQLIILPHVTVSVS